MTPEVIHVHVCGVVEIGTVTGKSGRAYRFEYDDYFGPMLITKKGKPWKRQPSDTHEFWPRFSEWLCDRLERKPRGDGEDGE